MASIAICDFHKIVKSEVVEATQKVPVLLFTGADYANAKPGEFSVKFADACDEHAGKINGFHNDVAMVIGENYLPVIETSASESVSEETEEGDQDDDTGEDDNEPEGEPEGRTEDTKPAIPPAPAEPAPPQSPKPSAPPKAPVFKSLLDGGSLLDDDDEPDDKSLSELTKPKRTATSANKAKPRSKAKNTHNGYTTAQIREWAQNNGHKVGDRGRIPDDVLAEFDKAHA